MILTFKSNTNDAFISCICACELDKKLYVHAVKVRDQRNCTPLLTAIAASHHKCVEELARHYMTELNALDLNGNSIYHLCALHENLDSLKYLLALTNSQNSMNVYALRNSFDETVLHLTSFNGNLEMINFVFNKLYETNGHVDEVVYALNRKGQTCFHVAANKGFFNLIEYFLKVNLTFLLISIESYS